MSRKLARILVFVTTASVLVIEILAVRILAPYLGVSLQVFTGVIGVILAGISVGAWLGGRTADERDPRRLIGPLLVAGGLSAAAAPLLVDLIGPGVSTGPVSIVLLALIGFFVPAALLSAVPPIIVKIRLASLDRTGSVVGSYSAIGTAGAIFGTFLTGFFLIAAFPTRPIVAALGAALTLSGIGFWVTGRPKKLVAALAALVGIGGPLLLLDSPCDFETTYHCAVVEVDESRPTGRTLVLDRLRNSYVDIADPTHLEFRYIRLFADVINAEASTGPLEVVSIGGGGFTMPGYLNATRPGSSNIVLEIDEPLVEIGKTELGLSDETTVVVDDARVSLRGVPDGFADVVIGDAFSGSSVPWHLTTTEYMAEIGRVLSNGGVYVMNVIDYGERRFTRSSAATLKEVFPHVALFAPPSYVTGPRGGNYVLVASFSPVDVGAIEAEIGLRAGTEKGLSGAALTTFIDGARPLTDDFAPVDQILGRP